MSMTISNQYREPLTVSIGNILRNEDDFESVVRRATGKDPKVFFTIDKPRYEQVYDVLKRLEREEKERWLLAFVVVFAHWDHTFRYLVFKASPSTLDSSIRLDEQVSSLVAKLEEAFASPISDELKDLMRQKSGEFAGLLREIETLLLHKNLYERLHLIKARFGREAMRDPQENIAMIVAACESASKINETKAHGTSIELDEADLVEIKKLCLLAREAQKEFKGDKVASSQAALLSLEQSVQQHLSAFNGSIFDRAQKLSLSFLIDDPSVAFLKQAQLIEVPARNLIPTLLARVLVRKVWQEASNELVLVKRLLEAGIITDSEDFGAHWFTLKSRIRWLTEVESNPEWSQNVNECAKAVDDMLAGAVEPVLGTKGAFDIATFEAYCAAFERGFLIVMLKFDFNAVADISRRLRQILPTIGIDDD